MALYRKIKPFRYRDYTVFGEVGVGLAGKVYLARRQSDNLLVALKVLHSTADNLIRDFFLNEQQMLRKANHPHVVRYVEGGANKSETFLATAYIEGTLLSELIDTAAPAAVVVPIIEQLAAALDYLHEQHPDHPITHCDVTPRNVIIDEDGKVTLFDLSSARSTLFAPAEDAAMLSPRYCAPEQLRHQPVPQSDQFALAVIAYELLTGKALFTNEQKRLAGDELAAHTNHDAVLAELGGELPRTAQVLNRALQSLPEARFNACGVFAAQLETALREDHALQGDLHGAVISHIKNKGHRRSRTGRWQSATLVGVVIAAAAMLFFPDSTLGQPTTTQVAQSPTAAAQGLPATQEATEQARPETILMLPTATLVTTIVPIVDPPTATTAATKVVERPAATVQPTARRPTAAPPPQRPQPTSAPPTNTPLPAGSFYMPNLIGYGENQAKEILAGQGVSADRIVVDYQSRSKLGSVFDSFPAYAVVSTWPNVGVLVQPNEPIVLGIRSPHDDTPPPPPATVPVHAGTPQP